LQWPGHALYTIIGATGGEKWTAPSNPDFGETPISNELKRFPFFKHHSSDKSLVALQCG
jgi:hypothetical protein